MQFFEVNVQQSNFKILQLLPQVLILFLVETTEIGQKNRRNFRVNTAQPLKSVTITPTVYGSNRINSVCSCHQKIIANHRKPFHQSYAKTLKL
jgi:hypothetical protein